MPPIEQSPLRRLGSNEGELRIRQGGGKERRAPGAEKENRQHHDLGSENLCLFRGEGALILEYRRLP